MRKKELIREVRALETWIENISWIQERILDTLNMRIEQRRRVDKCITHEHAYLCLVSTVTGEEIKFEKEKKDGS
jgi:hypothetical protein